MWIYRAMELTPEHGSLPSHLIRDERLDKNVTSVKAQHAVLDTLHTKINMPL
jgi:hypothetical protein